MSSRSGGLRWLIVVGVVGVGAGIAIAGIPTQAETFTIQPTESTSTQAASIVVPVAPTGP